MAPAGGEAAGHPAPLGRGAPAVDGVDMAADLGGVAAAAAAAAAAVVAAAVVFGRESHVAVGGSSQDLGQEDLADEGGYNHAG